MATKSVSDSVVPFDQSSGTYVCWTARGAQSALISTGANLGAGLVPCPRSLQCMFDAQPMLTFLVERPCGHNRRQGRKCCLCQPCGSPTQANVSITVPLHGAAVQHEPPVLIPVAHLGSRLLSLGSVATQAVQTKQRWPRYGRERRTLAGDDGPCWRLKV
jgi:hypothetical protein